MDLSCQKRSLKVDRNGVHFQIAAQIEAAFTLAKGLTGALITTSEMVATKTKKQIGIDVDGDGEADYYIDEDTYNQSPMQLWANVITRVVIMIGILGAFVSMFFA